MTHGTTLENSATRPETARWHRVHDVVGPLAGHDVPLALTVHGGVAGPVVATRTGRRHLPEVAPGQRASFGTYLNAFPAAQWRAHTGAAAARLTVEVDDVAVLTVLRSDGEARGTVVEKRLLAAGVRATVEVDITGLGAGGLAWFELRAGARSVRVVDASWAVAAAPRDLGTMVLGMPTIGRVADVDANLRRIAEAPALLDVVSRVVVVDHAPEPIAAALAPAADRLGDRLRIVRQPNLGGSGGFSRVLHEAVDEPRAGTAMLLDDDIVVDPVALLRAYEFQRRTPSAVLVGLQMLDTAHPGVLDAAAERIDERSFWWTPTDPALAGTDVTGPVSSLPALHRLHGADFGGWWGCLIPLDAVRRIGYAMPLFLKWDDAEYALRARAAGFGTVSLQGAAVWHESWRTKDDARTWPAYFHARNRMIVALLHGAPGVRSGLLAASFLLEVKQLLAHEVFAVERRHEGLRAVLDGPEALPGTLRTVLPRLLALAAAAPDQCRLDPAGLAAAPDAAISLLAPRLAPTGAHLGVWTLTLLLRNLLLPSRAAGAPAARLSPARGTWWVLPRHDHVLTPTADGAAYFRLRREPGRLRGALASSARLHLRLWVAWPRLRRRFRAQATALASRAAWEVRFGPGR